ncbi:LacI family DNA-binding transcriptional regulator [Marivirga sp. S37H4]|uniref:LacI family DNA-binding transcriptional regulator n=1 Tax=Marivirga aurantiaca TaxID=2802615 RepID=A0A934X0S0_9BACT|nr:LacI family DNA-binding transcriptional regulator [Marivirga aurantiaca]MBK6266387.1 LacI family DNA-binding transcriptional regulator [Marivirga aurantiaca]
MSKHNISLKDIARKLGVSIPTVSRALNNKPDIGKETKRKVIELAKALNYEPNQFAINFKNQQSYIIGVIIPKIVHHFFSNVISGIITEAEKSGYSVMLFQSNESYESELKSTQTFKRSMIDGLIISLSDNTHNVDHLKNLQDHKIPVVLIDKVTDMMEASKIVCNDYKGAYDATQHLISLGKRNIAHITGARKPTTTKERYRGYKDALIANGLPVKEGLIKYCDLISEDKGYYEMKNLISQDDRPDGIFCATDPTAIGAINAIKDSGLQIPKDIAVIGFSNWNMAYIIDPPLSSVKQPDYEMGEKASALIIEEIQNIRNEQPITFKTHVMETSLIIRESTVGKKDLNSRDVLNYKIIE